MPSERTAPLNRGKLLSKFNPLTLESMVTACSGFLGTNVFIIPHVLSFHAGKKYGLQNHEVFSIGQKASLHKQHILKPYTNKAVNKRWEGIENQASVFLFFLLDLKQRHRSCEDCFPSSKTGKPDLTRLLPSDSKKNYTQIMLSSWPWGQRKQQPHFLYKNFRQKQNREILAKK